MDEALLRVALEAADEAGVKLEMVGGLPVWEAFPGVRHQTTLRRIQNSVRPAEVGGACKCFTYQDVAVRFPDGSFKRPDLSIYCEELPLTDEATTRIPDAVVEVLSPGYEKKDVEIGVPFYVSMGIGDVVLVDPRAGEAIHVRGDRWEQLNTPANLLLTCGCLVEV